MLKGLRKRETYEELINELGDDPIKKYPDRRASQIENSNFMSQLASGFQEVIEQNDRILKEKTKELLLQEASASSAVSHRHVSIQRSLHTQHNIDDDHMADLLNQQMYITQARPGVIGSTSSVDWLHQVPAAREPQVHRVLNPDIQMSSSSSSNQPPQGTKRPQRFVIADDVDTDIQQHQAIDIDDLEMQQMHDDAKLFTLIKEMKNDHEAMGNTPIDEMLVDDAKMKKERRSIKRTDGDLEEEPTPKKQKPILMPKKEKENKIKKEKKTSKKGNKVLKHIHNPEDELEPRGPSGRPKGSKKKAVEDDEVEIQNVTLNDNKTMGYWKSQSANELRNQLKLRKIPSNTYWVTKKGLLKIVSELIKDKKW